MVLFFVLAGALLDMASLGGISIVGVAYLILRMLARSGRLDRRRLG